MGHELRVYKTTLRNQPLARAYSDSEVGRLVTASITMSASAAAVFIVCGGQYGP